MIEHVDELQAANDELATKVRQLAGAEKARDFSYRSSREMPSVGSLVPAMMKTGTSMNKAPAAAAGNTTGVVADVPSAIPSTNMSTTIDVASRKAVQRVGDIASTAAAPSLLDFVARHGAGGKNVMRASGNHELLGGASSGAPSSSMDTDIAAVRAASGF